MVISPVFFRLDKQVRNCWTEIPISQAIRSLPKMKEPRGMVMPFHTRSEQFAQIKICTHTATIFGTPYHSHDCIVRNSFTQPSIYLSLQNLLISLPG